MKAFRPLYFALLVAALAHAPQMLAGHEANGGYGVADPTNGRMSSLDLAMRGVSSNAYAPQTGAHQLLSDEAAWIDRVLRQVASDTVRSIIKTKLAEFKMRADETELGYPVRFLITNATNFTFLKHSDLRCNDVDDDESPYRHKTQLAYRVDRNIRFCQGFDQMDDANKAGLILHEIIYAAHTEKSKTVDLVGFLFSDDFREFDEIARREFNEIVDTMRARLRSTRWTKYTVQRLGSIAPHVVQAFSGMNGQIACFGEILNDENLALWVTMNREACRVGVIYVEVMGSMYGAALSGDFFEIKLRLNYTGRAEDDKYYPVGLINTQTLAIGELCTGVYRGCMYAPVASLPVTVRSGFIALDIDSLVQIDETLSSTLGVPAGQKVCAGKFGGNFQQLAVWLQDEAVACRTGTQMRQGVVTSLSTIRNSENLAIDYTVNFPIAGDARGRNADIPIGEFSPRSRRILSLCTGQFGGCAVSWSTNLIRWPNRAPVYIYDSWAMGPNVQQTLSPPEGYRSCIGAGARLNGPRRVNHYDLDYVIWLVENTKHCETGNQYVVATPIVGPTYWAYGGPEDRPILTGVSIYAPSGESDRLGYALDGVSGMRVDEFCSGQFDPTGRGCTVDWNAGTIVRNQ